MLFANDQRVELTRGGVERVNGRIDTQLGNLTGQYDSRVKVREGGRRRRIGQVIRGDVDGLHGSDRASLGRSDAFLQDAHLFRQSRLITYRGRHTTQQCGHFGPRQGVTIDVVDEQQNVTTFVTELLGDGQTGQCHAQTVTRRLVHLAIDQGNLVENVGFLHFVEEIVTFTSTLTHAREHGITAVLGGDVADQLHHVDGLADTGAAEQTDLAALGERADQVDDLDAGFQKLVGRCLFREARGCTVNRHVLFSTHVASFVDRLTQHVHDATQSRRADRHGDRSTGALNCETALEAFGRTHCDSTDHAVAQLLLDFEYGLAIGDVQGVVDLGHCVPRKLDVNHRADDLYDTSAHSWFLLNLRLKPACLLPRCHQTAAAPDTISEIS